MESPQTSNRKITEGDISVGKVNCTPKNQKTSTLSDEFCLYHLHRESSPNFRAGQDVLEIGWGDSPEPLKKKFELNKTPVPYKKKLEPKESPKSSIPSKRRNVRSSVNFPSKSIIDVAKYVAEVQELSKNIMKEFNKNLVEDESELIQNDRLSTSSTDYSPDSKNNCDVKNKDPSFDNVLQTFINEEDDWLSQALSSQEVVKTPHKGNFTKSKSENELLIPQSLDMESEKKSLTQNCRNFNNNNNNNNNFRRTSSFDLTKKSPHSVNSPSKKISETKMNLSGSNQYSVQEIERKRLEAKYRRERREIERRKLEALKKLEMKKMRAIKT